MKLNLDTVSTEGLVYVDLEMCGKRRPEPAFERLLNTTLEGVHYGLPQTGRNGVNAVEFSVTIAV